MNHEPQTRFEKFSQIPVKESWIIAHPSRLSNTYEPASDYIFQPQLVIPATTISVGLMRGVSIGPKLGIWVASKKRAKSIFKDVSSPAAFSFGGEYIYDARHIYNNNMAHLVQHHITSLCFIKKRLGLGPGAVKIVLGKEPPRMASQVFDLLGYETIKTDADVAGEILSVDSNDENLFHLIPCCNVLEFPGWIDNTPQKIFISRRGSRLLNKEEGLMDLLGHMGYTRLYFEDLSVVEQWSAVRNASEIVAIHGAALGALAFKVCSGARDFHLVELFGSGFVVNPFRKFCAAISSDSTWIGCRGRLEVEVIRDIDRPGFQKSHAFDSFEISPEVVEMAIRSRGLCPRPTIPPTWKR